MKITPSVYLSFFLAIFLAGEATAQSGNQTIGFKDIKKEGEGDRFLAREIKKKELQKAPSQIYAATKTNSPIIKKDKNRKKKKTNL